VYQGAANARWTQLRGKTRVYVVTDGQLYGNGQAASYRFAAKRLGLNVVGFERWNVQASSYVALARRIKRSGAGAVYLAGIVDNNGGRLVKDLRTVLGSTAVLIAPDGFTPVESVVLLGAGTKANGLYVSVAGPVEPFLGAAGKDFVAKFGAQTNAPMQVYTLYAAQSTEVLLNAIAASDGTRRSVIDKLFATQVTDGIMGSFAFDGHGDPTPGAVTIYQVVRGEQRAVGLVGLRARWCARGSGGPQQTFVGGTTSGAVLSGVSVSSVVFTPAIPSCGPPTDERVIVVIRRSSGSMRYSVRNWTGTGLPCACSVTVS
jgi:ABC-type branched-subunit amino acid transport system substrate-binding protein